MTKDYDVLVVGAGNAALCAALSAAETGASVLVLEKAPEYFRGGNTYFTGGAIRCAYRGLDDVKALIPDMSVQEEESLDVGSYTEAQYYDDLMRVTEGHERPRPGASAGESFPSHARLVAGLGTSICAPLWSSVLHAGRQASFLGGLGGGDRRRRQGPIRPALRDSEGTRVVEVWYEAKGSEAADG